MFGADSNATEFLRTAEKRAQDKGPRRTFLGTVGQNIQAEICVALPLLRKLPTDHHALLTTAGAQVIRTGDWSAAAAPLYNLASKSSRSINLCLVATFFILRSALRQCVPRTQIEKDLWDLDLPKGMVKEIVDQVVKLRESVVALAPNRNLGNAHVKQVSWRIDLALTSAKVKSMLQPTVCMRMMLDNGSVVSFEMSVERFQQLRYAVAKALAALHELQRHPMSKLMFWFVICKRVHEMHCGLARRLYVSVL